MKKIYMSFSFMLLALAFIAQDAGAQRTVNVAPGLGTLNDAIEADTLPNGDRNDPENTVFLLERGLEAYYGLEGTIENSEPLNIAAAEGDGPRPFLEPRYLSETGESTRPFRAKADLTLKGIHTTGFDNTGGLTDLRIIRASEDDIHITADDCWFDGDGQSFIRCDNPGMKIKVTNSIISRIGQPSSPDNGRGIDDRGNDIDTVIFENCTFYDLTSRIIRDGGGKIGYARFVNNTVFNIGQMGITFGAVEKVEMMNNLFVNTGFMPVTASTGVRYVFGVDSVEVDAVMQAPEITYSNNLFYFDSTQVAGYLGDTIGMPILINPTLAAWYLSKYGLTPPVMEPLTFNDQPPFADSVIIYDIYPEFDRNNAPGWVVPDVPAAPEGNGSYHAVVPYDFGFTNKVAKVMRGDNNWEAVGGDFATIDFERPWERQLWNIFGNEDGDAFDGMQLVMNPDMSGGNTSPMVMKFISKAGGFSWAGAWSDAYGSMTFTQEMHHMTMQVWKDKISDCGLKVEQGGTTTELKVPNTVTNAWETITFDFSANIGETLTRVVFFPDFADRDADAVSYVDNIKMIMSPVGVEKEQTAGLRVYPNPASTQLNVEYPGMEQILVRDVLGKLVQRVELQGQDQFTLPVSHLAGGVYFITVESVGNSYTTKFLKK
jgi:hypothetical protein